MVISTARQPAPDPDSETTATPVTLAAFLILLTLADGESHGYGIMQDADRITRCGVRLGPGTLYRTLQKLLIDGLIEELQIALDGEVNDDRRRCYRLTTKGRTVARAEARRLDDLVLAARERGLLGARPTSRGKR